MKRNQWMKIGSVLFCSAGLFLTTELNAQFDLKKKLNDLKKKVEGGIEKGLDKITDTTGRSGGANEKAKAGTTVEKTIPADNEKQQAAAPKAAQVPEKAYAKFDFIPGDQVLFEDDFRTESSDEIPSLWVVTNGKVEVARINGELVMGLLDKEPAAYPRQKTLTEYPDRITLEFDYLWRNNSKSWKEAWNEGNTAGNERLTIRFAGNEDYYFNGEARLKMGDFYDDLRIYSGGDVVFRDFQGKYASGEKVDGVYGLFDDLNDKWVHVSIAINERSMKVYLNQDRVLNAPINAGRILTFQLMSTSSSEESQAQAFIRNVRIAQGGADPYKQVAAEGKIIARGINFNVGKSTIRPESMGALNTIVKMMQDRPDLKFEIGGHTDSDGDDASNLKLSQERAMAVREKLISMGIDASRLTGKGYGETKPLSPNTTPEGKANNRRVELVKM